MFAASHSRHHQTRDGGEVSDLFWSSWLHDPEHVGMDRGANDGWMAANGTRLQGTDPASES